MIRVYGRRFGSISYDGSKKTNTPIEYVPLNDIIVRMIQDEPVNEKALRGIK